MKLTEGAVGFHLGNDGVDKDEEIVLPLAHQHTDFSVGENTKSLNNVPTKNSSILEDL